MRMRAKSFIALIMLMSMLLTGCQTKDAGQVTKTVETEQETKTEQVTKTADSDQMTTAVNREQDTKTVGAAGQGSEDSSTSTERIFIDSLGREIKLPAQIDTVAPSGQVAQMVLYTAAPDKLAGIAVSFTEDAKAFIDEKYTQLPVLGQFYGKNANLNMEELVKINPDVVVDIGQKKDGMEDDLNQLQEQIGIPVVFIEATFDTMDQTYQMLGELLGNKEEMQVLADYCSKTVEHAKTVTAELTEDEKVRVYIAREEEGLGTDAKGSFHAETLDLVGAVNAADVEVVGTGGGSIVSMEQLMIWNPDVILVYTEDVYHTIISSGLWAELDAVKNDMVYLIPSGPYNYISNPPSVNRLIGVNWLGNLLYPDKYIFDTETVMEFYEKFYHVTPTEEQLRTLIPE